MERSENQQRPRIALRFIRATKPAPNTINSILES
jgi:hypothetical protein